MAKNNEKREWQHKSGEKNSSNSFKTEKTKKKPSFHFSKDKIVFIIAISLIVLIGTGTYYFVNRNAKSIEEPGESITIDSIHEESGLSYMQKAYSLSNLESTDKAVEFLEDSAKQATDNPKAQAEFYSQAVIISLNDSQPEKALELAEKAYELNSTYETASLVATVAQILGDNDLELEYLRLALDEIPEEQAEADPDGSGYNYISERIRFLEEQ